MSSSDRSASSGIFLSLGSNVGNRERRLQSALTALEDEAITVLTCSSVYRTEPLYVLEQPDFLNVVCQVRTELSAHELLEACLRVERLLGRTRRVRKGPREIDIDILFFGQTIIADVDLVVPHPLLYERNFVLVPLAEIAPEFRDPRTGLTVLELRDQCEDDSDIERVGRLNPR